MAAPSKKKQAEMAERRNKALAYLQNGSATVNEIAKHLDLNAFVVTHTVVTLVYGGAVEHDGYTYIPNVHGKQTKVCKYKLTGKPFDFELARQKRHEKHDPKPQEETPPNVRRVSLLDKPCWKNQEGIGSGHHRVYIGSSRGW